MASKRTLALSERLDVLKVGHTVVYADPADAYRAGYVHPAYLHPFPYTDTEQPFVIIDGATDDDRTGQTSTRDRSNYRSLHRDYGDAFLRVSYAMSDGLGFFVRTVSDDVINTVCYLAYEYPVYDESDLSELEDDEIGEAFDAYLWWDTRDELSDEARDIAALFTQDEIRDAFYNRMSQRDEYPEHDGLDVRWSSIPTAEIMTESLWSLAASLAPAGQSETLV